MAGVTLGFLKYVLGLDTITFREGVTQADADLGKLQRSFATKGKQIQSLGKKMTAFATLPLVGSFSLFAKKGVDEAQRMVNAMAQVNSALKSTGGVAGLTGEQLKKTAEAFETKSLFESEDILKDVSARLLAFGSVHGATFNRAQQDILDYAQRSGKDLGASAILIGKALDNPAKAEGALRKAGVTLSEGQRDLIKQLLATGDAAGAQNVILGALETKFSGAAKAAADVDPYHKMHVAFKQLAETVGNALLPLIPPVTGAITAMIGAFTSLSPATQKWLLIAAGTATVLGPTLIAVGNLLIIVGKVGPAVTLMVKAWELLRVAFIAARVAALATLPALTPFLIPLAAIAAAVGLGYLAWKNWDKIKAIVVGVYTAVKTWLGDKLAAILNALAHPIAAVTGWFHDMYDKVVGHSYVPDMVDGIAAHFGRLQDVMVAPATKAAKAVTSSFAQLKDDLSALLDQLFPEIAAAQEKANQLATLTKGLHSGLISEPTFVAATAKVTGANQVSDDIANPQVLDHMSDLSDLFDTLPDQLVHVIDLTSEWGKGMAQIGQGALQSIVQGLGEVATGQAKLGDVAVDTFKRMTAALVQLAAEMLILKAVQALFGASSSAAGFVSQAFGLSGARAAGGPVLGNNAYLVGERGPEIFVPSNGGRIVSNDNMRRGFGAQPINLNVTVNPHPGMTSAEARATGRQAALGARDVLAHATGAGRS